MDIAILARTALCTNVIEYLNSFGSQINYIFTPGEYFGEREIAIFSLTCKDPEDIPVILSFIKATFSSDGVIAIKYISEGRLEDG